jgi:hypothetical protein
LPAMSPRVGLSWAIAETRRSVMGLVSKRLAGSGQQN